MKRSTNRFGPSIARLATLALIGATIAAPAAMGGTDSGIGIPAGRDGVPVPGQTRGTIDPARSAALRPPVNRLASSSQTKPSFNWTDGAIGAGGATVVLLLATAGTLVVRRRRERLMPS